MRRLIAFLVAGVVLASIAPALAEPQPTSITKSNGAILPILGCDKWAAIDVSASGNTQVIAAPVGQQIEICGIYFLSAGITTDNLVYGTGTACATGTTYINGSATAGHGYALGAQTGFSMGIGAFPIVILPVNQAFCITQSAAVVISGTVSYMVI